MNGARIQRPEAKTLAEEEFRRFAVLVGSLTPAEWDVQTDCTLWNVRKDRAQLAVRRRIQNVAVVAVAALAVGTAVIHGMILLISGTAGGLTRLFGDRGWLGDLLAGVLFLALIGGGLALGLHSWNRSQLAKQKKKYAELHRKRGQSATP